MKSMPVATVLRCLSLTGALGGIGCSPDARLAELERRVDQVEHRSVPAASATVVAPPVDTGPGPFEGWFMSGGGSRVYDVVRDPQSAVHGKPGLLLTPVQETFGKYGTFMTHIDASQYLGKRVRVSAMTKTQGATDRADFWARVQAADSPGDGQGLGGGDIELPPMSEWTHREVVMEVPAEGKSIQFGVGIAGPGRLWVEEPKLEVVGNDVPLTISRAGRQKPGAVINGWLLSGNDLDAYEIGVESATKHGGKTSGWIRSTKASTGFGTLMQDAPASRFVGKRVRLSAFVKTESVEKAASLWLRLDAPGHEVVGFDNMSGRPIKGTSDWKRYDIVMDVPTTADRMAFGLLVTGQGRAWIDDIKLEAVDAKVPLTTPEPSDQPQNLDFER